MQDDGARRAQTIKAAQILKGAGVKPLADGSYVIYDKRAPDHGSPAKTECQHELVQKMVLDRHHPEHIRFINPEDFAEKSPDASS